MERNWEPFSRYGKTDEHGRGDLKPLDFLEQFKAPSAPVQPKSHIPEPDKDNPENRGVFGRKKDIQQVLKLLQNNPIVIIYGLSGVGKTKLIAEVARKSYPDSYFHFSVSPKIKLQNLQERFAPTLECPVNDKNNLPVLIRTPALMRKLTNRLIHIEKAHELFSDKGFHSHSVYSFRVRHKMKACHPRESGDLMRFPLKALRE